MSVIPAGLHLRLHTVTHDRFPYYWCSLLSFVSVFVLSAQVAVIALLKDFWASWMDGTGLDDWFSANVLLKVGSPFHPKEATSALRQAVFLRLHLTVAQFDSRP